MTVSHDEPRWPHKPAIKLMDFHQGRMLLASGHRRADLLTLTDADFERHHGFIQWAFPTPEKSYNNFSAPLLDLGTAIWLAEDGESIDFLERMTVRFLQFLRDNNHWRSSYNHNHLRITRVMNSLRILHSWDLAQWFHEQVINLAGDSYEQMTRPRLFWEAQSSSLHDRIAGSVVGLAVGDALGAPVEFTPRGQFPFVQGYQAGGRFNLPAGAWTDDTAMALCLADSLIANGGFDPADLLQRFCNWAEHGDNTSTGVTVGIGQNTLRALGDYRRTGRLMAEPFGAKNDGNGSLMRLSPAVCFASHHLETAIDFAVEQSHTTHASPIAEECCRFTAALIYKILRGAAYGSAKEDSLALGWSDTLMSAVAAPLAGVDDALIPSGGYVLDSLRAALWCIENTNSFENAVLLAVNLGDDADTTGAITGQIAGAMYGYSSIDPELKKGLFGERRIYVTSQFLGRSFADSQ
ncbi:ADP-ribosylglycohydrolase family protein [Roseicyclus sp.]|uniref:ADP-ribosylglycohydrolase family protein n=2 Tax=Roseicyclus sp. TaxID=1914329 RepID=UPI001BCC7D2F|nr:ADP-ribosylglycohydrolase family protein [Roseicyclus sp.]